MEQKNLNSDSWRKKKDRILNEEKYMNDTPEAKQEFAHRMQEEVAKFFTDEEPENHASQKEDMK